MASMFVRHRVKDFSTWKPVFEEHETARKEYGISAHSVHRDADDPNVIIIALRVSDISRAREFARSESLYTAMERAGVQGTPEIWFAEDLEERKY